MENYNKNIIIMKSTIKCFLIIISTAFAALTVNAQSCPDSN